MTNTDTTMNFEPEAVDAQIHDAVEGFPRKVLRTAIRNPDATFDELARATSKNLPDGPAAWGELRRALDAPFAALTDKQKAVVDYFAGHPDEFNQLGDGLEWVDASRRVVNATDVSLSKSYVNNVLGGTAAGKDRTPEVHYRRAYTALGDDAETPRLALSHLADGDLVDLPRSNVTIVSSNTPDDADGADDGTDTPDLPTTTRPHCTHEYAILPASATADDVEYGVRYYGTVNNTVGWGVFVTLGDTAQTYDDLSALVHKSCLPPLYTPSDFTVGDEVGVMLVDRRDNGDIGLEMVATLETARNHKWEADEPRRAPNTDSEVPVVGANADTNTDDTDGGEGPEPEPESDSGDDPNGYEPEHFDPPTKRDDLYALLDGMFDAIDEAAGSEVDVDVNHIADIVRESVRDDIPEPDFSVVEERLDHLDEQVGKTRAWVGHVNADVEMNRSKVNDLAERTDALEEAIESGTESDRERVLASGGAPGDFAYVADKLNDLYDGGYTVDSFRFERSDGTVDVTVTASRGDDE